MEPITNNKIIFEYFDIILNEKISPCRVELSLKEFYKINKPFPLKCIRHNKRICLTGKPYFIHYLGKDIGESVYNQRKLLRKQYNALRWYSENIELDINTKTCLKNISDLLKENEKKLHSDIKNQFWNSKSGLDLKTKYSNKSEQHKNLSESNKKLWQNEEYKKTIINKLKLEGRYSFENHGRKVRKFYNDPKNKDFIKQIMNNPVRTKKVSDRAKLMWNNAKKYNKELYYRMINTSKNKNFILNGHRMNSIEYKVGSVLNELGEKWEYEKIFDFKTNCYLPDFYVESKKLIIECYGDFWHANPNLFSENQPTHKTRTAKQIWQYDKLKKETFEKKDINICISGKASWKMICTKLKQL